MIRAISTCLILLSVAITSSALAHDAQKEDLAGCKVPHGELVIPDRNTPEARNGYILRLSDGTLNPSPLKDGERPKSAAELLARLASEKAGDLIYSPLNGGTFIAISGRASDLGKKFLYELSGTTLDRPKPVQGTKERSASGEGTPGAIEGIEDGHCYLIQTTDARFALVRVVQKRGRMALIQYVYQPNGKPEFDVPKSKPTTVPPLPSPSASPAPALTVAGSVTDVKTLLAARDQMITKLIAVVKAPAKTQSEIIAKAEAIQTLGQLRAVEAASALVGEIEFSNPYAPSRELSIENFHPATEALVQIGKPGSVGSLDAIEKERLNLAGEEVKKAKLRLYLLTLVIRGVEGVDVAEFMVKNKMEKAPANAHASYEFVLSNIRNPKSP